MPKTPEEYNPTNPEHQSQPMTDDELKTIIRNSKLSAGIKEGLLGKYNQDKWIKEQMLGICTKIDQEDWPAVSDLWIKLEKEWNERNK